MILEGCQTIQWRRHFDQIPSLLIFFLRFFLERIQCVSSSTSFRIERFWRNKATCSLFHSCSREHVWCPLPPLSYAPPSYRGEVSFPGFCPRFQTRHSSGGEYSRAYSGIRYCLRDSSKLLDSYLCITWWRLISYDFNLLDF